MKRKYSLFSLMAVTALSLSLAACDDADKAAAPEAAAPVAEEVVSEVVAPAPVTASGVTAYATAEGAANGAVFLTLHNEATTPDRLIGVTSTAASTVELHESKVDENGIMQMNKVEAIEIPAQGTATLEVGGYHIMLLGLGAPLVTGTPFNVTLDFETAADTTVSVQVVAPAGAAATEHSHEGHDHASEEAAESAPADGATTDEAPADVSVEETATPETTVPAPDASATDASAEAHDHADGHDHSH